MASFLPGRSIGTENLDSGDRAVPQRLVQHGHEPRCQATQLSSPCRGVGNERSTPCPHTPLDASARVGGTDQQRPLGLQGMDAISAVQPLLSTSRSTASESGFGSRSSSRAQGHLGSDVHGGDEARRRRRARAPSEPGNGLREFQACGVVLRLVAGGALVTLLLSGIRRHITIGHAEAATCQHLARLHQPQR